MPIPLPYRGSRDRTSAFQVAFLIVALLATPAGVLAAVITRFTPRFAANDIAEIVFVANTVLRADPNASGAANAQNGIGTGAAVNNNGFAMVNVDVDGDPATFNSSRADMNLPAGSTVLFAGLYWGPSPTRPCATRCCWTPPRPAATSPSPAA